MSRDFRSTKSDRADRNPAAAPRRQYRKPALTRHGTIVELTLGAPEGEVEAGGMIPNIFASTGTG